MNKNFSVVNAFRKSFPSMRLTSQESRISLIPLSSTALRDSKLKTISHLLKTFKITLLTFFFLQVYASNFCKTNLSTLRMLLMLLTVNVNCNV